jgi:hypothetical protein
LSLIYFDASAKFLILCFCIISLTNNAYLFNSFLFAPPLTTVSSFCDSVASSACGLVVSLSFSVTSASLDLLDFGADRFKGAGNGSSPRGSVSKLARPN